MIPPKKKKTGIMNNKVNDFSAMEACILYSTIEKDITTQKEMMETERCHHNRSQKVKEADEPGYNGKKTRKMLFARPFRYFCAIDISFFREIKIMLGTDLFHRLKKSFQEMQLHDKKI